MQELVQKLIVEPLLERLHLISSYVMYKIADSSIIYARHQVECEAYCGYARALMLS